jgi:hypothetical protein
MIHQHAAVRGKAEAGQGAAQGRSVLAANAFSFVRASPTLMSRLNGRTTSCKIRTLLRRLRTKGAFCSFARLSLNWVGFRRAEDDAEKKKKFAEMSAFDQTVEELKAGKRKKKRDEEQDAKVASLAAGMPHFSLNLFLSSLLSRYSKVWNTSGCS